MLVDEVIVVVEVEGMALSDSDESDMLELNELDSLLDIEDRSVNSWPEVDSEANALELVIGSWVEVVDIDEASFEVDDSSCNVDIEMSEFVE